MLYLVSCRFLEIIVVVFKKFFLATLFGTAVSARSSCPCPKKRFLQVDISHSIVIYLAEINQQLLYLSCFNSSLTMASPPDSGSARVSLATEATPSTENRVSFTCQRCLAPLHIDASFYALNEHTLAEIKLPISPTPPFEPGEGGDPGEGGEAKRPPFCLQGNSVAFLSFYLKY